MFYCPPDLTFGMVTINSDDLAGLQQVSILNLVTVCLVKKRPLVRIVIDSFVARNTPEMIAGLDRPNGKQRRRIGRVSRHHFLSYLLGVFVSRSFLGFEFRLWFRLSVGFRIWFWL